MVSGTVSTAGALVSQAAKDKSNAAGKTFIFEINLHPPPFIHYVVRMFCRGVVAYASDPFGCVEYLLLSGVSFSKRVTQNGLDARAIQCLARYHALMSRQERRRFSGPVPPR